jgi:hypothetical protein
MRKLLLLPLLFGFGCSNSLMIEREEVSKIPAQSPAVIVESRMHSDSLFKWIAVSLDKSGWVVSSSREAGQLSCAGRELAGNVFLKPMIKVEPVAGGGSRAYYMGLWSTRKIEEQEINFWIGPYFQSPQKITWLGYNTKPGIAYQHLVKMARKLPSSEVKYLEPGTGTAKELNRF